MPPRVLIAAPSLASRPLAGAVVHRFTLTICTEAPRARALLQAGCFQAVITVDGFLDGVEHPAKTVLTEDVLRDEEALVVHVMSALTKQREEDDRRAYMMAAIASLPHAEYMELARWRTTREYLLAIMAQHRGNITDAARGVGVARESLHRLLRRHEVDPERFRGSGGGNGSNNPSSGP